MLHATLLLVLSVLPAPATARQGADSPSAVANDERSQERNRILHLAGGGTLRARTRWAGDRWEYRAGGEWAALDPRAVVRVALERDVLSEARELEKKVGRDDATQRVALADWMLRAGLTEEGLEQLDRVLLADPDQEDALRLLRNVPVPIATPAEAEPVEEALRRCAGAPPALREITIARLGARADAEEVIEGLKKALVSHSVRLRALAARALRRLRPDADLRAMVCRAVLDGSEEVRREAALTLRDVKNEAVTVPVVRALGSDYDALRENAVAALGDMGYPEAVPALLSRLEALSSPQGSGGWRPPAANIFIGRQIAYIQDFDVQVAQFAAVADPQINTLIEGSVLDVRVIGVWETSIAIESRKIRLALLKLTGASPGSSNRSWLDWWEENRSRFGVPTEPAQPRTRAD